MFNYGQEKVAPGSNWVDNNRYWLGLKAKLEILKNYLNEKVQVRPNQPIKVSTLQIASKKKAGTDSDTKKITYVHRSQMEKEKFIEFLIRTIIGSSSSQEAGRLRTYYNGHDVHILGIYNHQKRKEDCKKAHQNGHHLPQFYNQIAITCDKASNFSVISPQLKGGTKTLSFYNFLCRLPPRYPWLVKPGHRKMDQIRFLKNLDIILSRSHILEIFLILFEISGRMNPVFAM